jgi:acetyltransferase
MVTRRHTLEEPKHYLTSLFEPTSVAIFGASERTTAVGGVVLRNIIDAGFAGEVYPVNPGHDEISGLRCYPDLGSIDGDVELVVIATPAATVPSILESCGEKGVTAAIVLSAGFREAGAEGSRLEHQAIEVARLYGIRFLGPNCLGLIRPSVGLNATFANGTADAGNLALVSQSGALCTAIVDWAENRDIGFSAVVSLGISANIDFGEILDYLVSDPKTDSILMYIEGIQDARAFMSALRAAARVKPVIVVKAGRHQAGEQAAVSHTGALSGSDDVFDAALRRAGVVRGVHVGDLFAAAAVLVGRTRIHGDRLAIVTNAGGPAVMACDKAADLDIALAELSQETLVALDAVLPSMWSHGNPIDVLGDADAGRYADAIQVALDDRGVDGVLVMLTPQAMTDPTAVARRVIEVGQKSTKPVLTCWMGGAQVRESRELFARAPIPTFRLPETAVQGFSYLTQFHRNQELLIQTPGPMSSESTPDITGAQLIIDNVLAEGRSILTEVESKAVLAAFRVPVTPSSIARTSNEAIVAAETLGFPVAMKIHSHDITHKSDIGGVRLDVDSAGAVQRAFDEILRAAAEHRPEAAVEGVLVQPMVSTSSGVELLIGINRDPVFGPVVVFGSGGTELELLSDKAVCLPPLNHLLVDDMIGRTRAARRLAGYRGKPAADVESVRDVLLRVSEMACELPSIKELDINPLIAGPDGVIAADARIVVDRHFVDSRRYSHTAIHPYPSHLVSTTLLAGGVACTIRPIRPEDAEMERAFVDNLSPEAKHFRFMSTFKQLSATMLARFTQIDYDREMAFVAVIDEDGVDLEIGVCRYIINPDGETCEFAVVVADDWQGRGVAHKLMEVLIEYARYRNLESMEGFVLADNEGMKTLARSLGFRIKPDPQDPGMVRTVKSL